MTPLAASIPNEKIMRPAERKTFAGSRDFGIDRYNRLKGVVEVIL